MTKEILNATRLPMITPKRVGWDKAKIQKRVLANEDEVIKLYHLVGTATQAVVKTSEDYEGKESIEFRGSFMAIDCETGERFKSGKVYLPSVVEAEIAAAVQSLGMAELALTVTAEYAEKSATSYSFNVESYGKEDNRSFEALLAMIPGMDEGAPRLEAPKPKAKTKAKR